MPRLIKSLPKYRCHKASGQAIVSIAGRDHYLGPWKSKASLAEYDRLISEWLVRGRRPEPDEAGITVVELLARYWQHAKIYYRKNKRPTGELGNIRQAIRPFNALYGQTLAEEFGPLRIKAVRVKMIDADLSRSVINARIAIIKRIFKWAAEEELVSARVHTALTKVKEIAKGRTAVRESKPVKPVPDAIVDATLPHLPRVVADMVRFQRLTGSRPGEVCVIRPCDVDRTSEVWVFRPHSHKMEHEDLARVIFIGPKAQAVLLPYLLRDSHAYCFSPAESESQRKAEMRARRQTKVQPSQIDRSKDKPRRKPRNKYDRCTYLTAVYRGCDKAFGKLQGPVSWIELAGLADQRKLKPRDMVRHGSRNRWKRAAAARGLFRGQGKLAPEGNPPPAEDWYYKTTIPRWSPNQLRHAAGTEIRSRFGLEAAQVVLGHSKADVTQTYAERDMAKAAEIMKEVG